MAEHKDGKIEPRSKANHDHHAFERHKKAKQDLHPRFGEQSSSKRPTRATRGAPQYRDDDGDSSLSSYDDTEDYIVEHRKRKSTDRESDDDSTEMMVIVVLPLTLTLTQMTSE